MLGSVSDKHKTLLFTAPDIWTLLTLGLFLDAEQHPRGQNAVPPSSPVPVEIQAIWQRNYAEALQQLALFPPGREAILQQPSIMKALEEVAERGMSPEAREHAEGALIALSDKEMQAVDGDGPKHIMLSYQVTRMTPLVCSSCFVCSRVRARCFYSGIARA